MTKIKWVCSGNTWYADIYSNGKLVHGIAASVRADHDTVLGNVYPAKLNFAVTGLKYNSVDEAKADFTQVLLDYI